VKDIVTGVGGDVENWVTWVAFPNYTTERAPVRLWHDDVGDKQVKARISAFKGSQCRSGAVHCDSTVPALLQHPSEHFCGEGFVVHDQDARDIRVREATGRCHLTRASPLAEQPLQQFQVRSMRSGFRDRLTQRGKN
jgi:hypothetical protein